MLVLSRATSLLGSSSHSHCLLVEVVRIQVHRILAILTSCSPFLVGRFLLWFFFIRILRPLGVLRLRRRQIRTSWRICDAEFLLESAAQEPFDEVFLKISCFKVNYTLAEQIFSVLLRARLSLDAVNQMFKNNFKKLLGIGVLEEALEIINGTTLINYAELRLCDISF